MMELNSPNRGASSETSEAQSIEENTSGLGTLGTVTSLANTNSSTLKSWKNMKGSSIVVDTDAGESRRPPWRAVSVSTLPKPDKNAILRAKLLDASRRLRAGKSAIGVQTEMVATKLMKEVSLGSQMDLKHLNDVGILTDGLYTMKKTGSGEFILTRSVSKTTEDIPVRNASTQTLLPKVPGDAFMEAYFKQNLDMLNLEDFTLGEQKLLQQIQGIRESKRLRSISVHKPMVYLSPEDSLPVVDTDIMETETTCPPSSSSKPTYSSWHFDSDDEHELSTHPPYKTTTRARPRIRFTETGLDSKPLYTRWVPNGQGETPQNYRTINIDPFILNAIDELILESNNLVDFIEDFDARHQIAPYQLPTPIFPSDYWLSIMDKQEKDLAKKISTLKYINIRKVNKFD